MRIAPLIVASCLVATTVRAQLPGGTGRISGTVRSASDSARLSRAHVVVVGSWRVAQTNDSGSFAFDNVPAGVQRFEVRRLGYRAVDTTIHISLDASTVINIQLTPLPQRLAEVEVRGKKIVIPAHLQAVYERANRNHGTLITADDIKRRNPLDTKSMFDGIPGIHVMNSWIIFVRCSDPKGTPSPFQTAPRVQVYVNGGRVTVVGDPAETYAVIQSIYPSDIELIEVYTGVARIPAEFVADACAVVAIWTKSY